MVALLQSLLGEPLPAIRSVDRFGHLHRDLEVSTFNGKFEPGVGVLDEVKSNLKTLSEC